MLQSSETMQSSSNPSFKKHENTVLIDWLKSIPSVDCVIVSHTVMFLFYNPCQTESREEI